MRWGGRGAVCSLIGVICFQNIYKLCLGLSFVIWIITEHLYIFFCLPVHMQMYIQQRGRMLIKSQKLEYLWFDHFIHCKLKIFVNGVSTLTFFSFQGVDSHFNI